MSSGTPVTRNPWTALRRFTPARIALGRAGASLPTQEVLAFGLAHARARDAVHEALDVDTLEQELASSGHPCLRVHSAAPNRTTYLARPDLGRRLDETSAERLAGHENKPGIVVAIEDGLSAVAVQKHVVPLMQALRTIDPDRWSNVPAVIALQGRVALGDEIGERLGACLVVVMIGERPGLSSPDSLGLYITHSPKIGRTDAERNCISNVRPEGLGYEAAAAKLDWLVSASLSRGVSGIALKDESAPQSASELP